MDILSSSEQSSFACNHIVLVQRYELDWMKSWVRTLIRILLDLPVFVH